MEENKELDEQMSLFEDEVAETDAPNHDELKEAIEETLNKVRTQSMLLGAQSMCQVISNKIYAFERKPGSKSTNDYKRLVKDIKNFVEIGLSRKVNLDGTTSPRDDNNNTKLMEE